MNDDLFKYRSMLDEVDNELRKLFLKRCDISRKIGDYKKENSLTITDESREKEIIDRQLKAIGDSEYLDEYRMFYQNIIELSKKIQKKAK